MIERRYHVDGSIPNNAVWVFGSNLAGRHGAGAAKVAANRFGARYGKGYGFAGQSFAIPTKDENLKVLPLYAIIDHIEGFVRATHHPFNSEVNWFVTRVGCGLAGYKDEQIAPYFRDAINCSFAEEWRPYLENENE